MSTRQLLNMTMGAFAMLLFAAIGIVFSTTGSQDDQNTRIDLAVRQQILIQDLTREAAALNDAEDRDTVAAAREQLARTIVQFDRNLTALLHGGQAVDANGQTVVVDRTRNDMARIALEDGAHLWVETGMPLADLAAGEFSVFSAAGQKAVKGLQANNVELMQHMGTAANSLRMGLHARATIARIAQWAAAGLGIILIGLGLFRRRLLTPANSTAPVPARTTPESGSVPAGATSATHTNTPSGLPGVAPGSGTFSAPVNFDSVSASVDQMSVDMNTIAGSTEKMRLAIDSVGHALQGMLYSLNEMAQDTAEGHKIVNNANNAASFTATTAADLAASAREMADVVTRVTQLALKTKQVAAQIDGEAVHTGKTGEAFTSVVAGEVKGLSLQTNQATHEIEETVAGILATARQYEEAIGQIIKNISAINKVSQNLGQLMLSPPPRVEPGPPLPAAPALTPSPVPATPVASEPVPAAPDPVPTEPAAVMTDPGPTEPAAAVPTPETAEPVIESTPPVADDPVIIEATPDEVAAETASAIEEVVETTEPESGSNGNVFMLGGRTKRPNALNIPAVPPSPEPDPEPEAAAEPETPAAETTPAPAPDGGSNGNVFMLGGPKKEAPAVDPTPPAEPKAEPKAETPPEPAADPEPVSDAPVADGGSGQNVFLLNKPKGEPKAKTDSAPAAATPPTPEPEPEAPAPAAEPPATEIPAPADFSGPNVYDLELPAGSVTDAEDTPEPAAIDVPETVPAGAEEAPTDEDSNANIFMLNKPK